MKWNLLYEKKKKKLCILEAGTFYYKLMKTKASKVNGNKFNGSRNNLKENLIFLKTPLFYLI